MPQNNCVYLCKQRLKYKMFDKKKMNLIKFQKRMLLLSEQDDESDVSRDGFVLPHTAEGRVLHRPHSQRRTGLVVRRR